MALVKKSDGGPNHRFFEATETVSQFDSIRSWLTRNCKKVSYVCMILHTIPLVISLRFPQMYSAVRIVGGLLLLLLSEMLLNYALFAVNMIPKRF